MSFNDKVFAAIHDAENEIGNAREELSIYVAAIERYEGDDLCVLGKLISEATTIKLKLESQMAFAVKYYGDKKQCLREMVVGYYQTKA